MTRRFRGITLHFMARTLATIKSYRLGPDDLAWLSAASEKLDLSEGEILRRGLATLRAFIEPGEPAEEVSDGVFRTGA